jgi:hypothetical protein
MTLNRIFKPLNRIFYRAAVVAAGALAIGALVYAAPQAEAATVYVCANRDSGVVRMVARTARCRRGESKLSWSTTGPAGANGANGANGKDGAQGREGAQGKEGAVGKNGLNGAVAGYFASNFGPVWFTEAVEVTVVSKTIPPGNYLVFAKTAIYSTAGAAVRAGAVCELLDNGTVIDASLWTQTLAKWGGGTFMGESTLPEQAALSTKEPTTLTLTCSDRSADESGQTIGAYFSQIDAVQTTQNS